MSFSSLLTQTRQHLAVATSLFALIVNMGAPTPVAALDAARQIPTSSPIKHVIVIIGENRSFDHVFATYQPKSGQTVWNLLSEGIINADGTPGPNFAQAEQLSAADQAPDTFLLSPAKTAFPSHLLPAPLSGGPTDSYI